jgi:uncharacterized membrane protein
MGLWEYLYLVIVYSAAVLCFVAAIRTRSDDVPGRAITEVLILIVFAVGYWLLESFAHLRAPFYVYPDLFPDMVRYFDWAQFGFSGSNSADAHVCAHHGFDKISLTIPLLEMSMTYCLMWTARLLLTPHGWGNSLHAVAVAPFIVGLFSLCLDGFLDPIVSESFTCLPETMNHAGMAYWIWYAEPDLANFWYGIPMFNFAAWFSAPVIMVTGVLIIHWFLEYARHLRSRRRDHSHPAPAVRNFLLQLIVFLAFVALYVTSPDVDPPWLQIVVMTLALLTSVIVVIRHGRSYKRDHPFRWELVVPQVVVFTLPVPMLLFSGVFVLTQQWILLLLSLALSACGIFFAVSPYSAAWLAPNRGAAAAHRVPDHHEK